MSFDKILRANDAGIVRACADDIGISIRKLKHLHLIYPTFKECKELGGLALKPIRFPKQISSVRVLAVLIESPW